MYHKKLIAAFVSVVISIVAGVPNDANAQTALSEQPSNSLRTVATRSAKVLRIATNPPSLISSDDFAVLDFEMSSGTLADEVVSDQVLADLAYGHQRLDDREKTHLKSFGHGPAEEVIRDYNVCLASCNESNFGGFSAVSNVVQAACQQAAEPEAVPKTATDAPVLAEAMPEEADPSAQSPTAQSLTAQSPLSESSLAESPTPQPLPAPTPIGPAYPADFAFDTPLSKQTIGDLQEGIKQQQKLLALRHDDGDVEHSRRVKLLDESQGFLLQADKFFKKDLIQRNSIKTFDTDKKILQEKLAVDRKPNLPRGGESADDLFSHLESLRQEMDSLNKRIHELNEVELQHKVRLSDIPKDRADARKGFAELDKRLKTEELGEADTFLMMRLRAEELELEYRIDSLDSESKLYELENRLLPMNNDLLARESKVLETEIESWNFAANQRRRQDLEEEARFARAQVIEAAPALRNLATLNAELTERRLKFTEQIRAATDEEIEVKELLNDVSRQHETVEKSIVDNTLSHADGMLLVDVRRKMIRPFKSHQRIRQINSELQEVSLERIKLNELREPLSHPVEYTKDVLANVHSESISDKHLFSMGLEIVESIRQQYDQLSADHHTYIDLLGKIVAEREGLVQKIDATMQFVNQNSLWVRSAQPLSVEQVSKSRFAVTKFFSPQQWTHLLSQLTNRSLTRPHESAAGLIGLIGLFVFSRRFKA